MLLDLSNTQKKVLDSIVDWHSSPSKRYLTLGGYAGTGKTTLIGHLAKEIRKKNPKLSIAFCSYTGKAVRILEQKLKEAKAVKKGDSVSTIHRLIYSPVVNDRDEVIGWERRTSDKFNYGLIIVDEASMVNEKIWHDLLSYGVPVLAVGDHGQLPPIEGKFNLMEDPELRLEEIYRQEAGNPIIQLSERARREGKIDIGNYSRGVRKLDRTDPETQEFLGEMFSRFEDEMMVLVGYNHTRIKINKAIRELLDFQSPNPQIGDRVICLRNNYNTNIFNGAMGTVLAVDPDKDEPDELYRMELMIDGEDKTYSGKTLVKQFGEKSTLNDERRKGVDLFDFGYAVTVHKAQGSQANKVVVFEERFSKMNDQDWKRWLYTAVTRASDELYIVGS